ncbi:MAG: MBL fold metallo-hydrolase [Dehalococcoidales bacterium]|nr:MBL fold metallo-hydrolase [Dehalococcoidales bacterium]
MLERKKGIPSAPDKIEVHKLNDAIRTVQCNLHQESHYAYTSWVITDDGVVVLDTGSGTVAPLVKEEIARETDKPVKYLIYSHGHFDHIGGASAYMDQHPEVIGHENVIPRLERYKLTGEYIRRIMRVQILRNLPVTQTRIIYPTITYRDEYRFQLGGKTFELFHGNGETDDCTLVWMPELKAVFCGDLLEASFPNLGNPFKVMRYAAEWADTLERALALKPDLAIGGDAVLTDNREITEHFNTNIELLRFLQNSVIEAANQGKNLEQMIEEIQLPPHLENSPILRPLYSRREFAIYNIWRRYCGYFDFSPTSILPRPKRELASVARGLIGDDEAIVRKANDLMNNGQMQLALETLDIILKVDYENVPARRLRMEILQKLADNDICLMSHNVWEYFMEEDREFLK